MDRQGHRTVPHTADLRIEAWAESCPECIAEALRGLAESVADVTGVAATRTVTRRLAGATPADLLAAAADEVIFVLDTSGEIPVSIRVAVGRRADAGIVLTMKLARATAGELIGAVPKAVSLHGLACEPVAPGHWSASMTVDV